MSFNNSTFSLEQNFLSFTVTSFVVVTNVYTIPIVSVIGIILNIPCLIVFASPKFSGETYKYLLFKTLIHLVVLLLATLNTIANCLACIDHRRMDVQIFLIYYRGYLVMVPFTMVALVEIALAYDRLCMFKSNMFNLSFKHTLIAIAFIAFVFNIPYLIAFRVEEAAPGTNIFIGVRSQFGHTLFYRIYIIFFNMIQSIVAFAVLLLLNAFVTIEFRKYLSRKRNLTKKQSALNEQNRRSVITKVSDLREANRRETFIGEKKMSTISLASKNQIELASKNQTQQRNSKIPENDTSKNIKAKDLSFTSMIVVSSVLFTVTRLFNFINSLSIQVLPLIGISAFTSTTGNVISFVSLFSTIFYCSSSVFTYFFFNKLFRSSIKKLFFLA
jgi:hypothetical protein